MTSRRTATALIVGLAVLTSARGAATQTPNFQQMTPEERTVTSDGRRVADAFAQRYLGAR
jgi:hypothetical protein